MVYVEPDQIWMVVVGFLIAMILAMGIGANDVANSFGTSVGSKVLTLKHACILASVFETLGAVFLGAKVSDTIRKGIIDVQPYQNDTDLLMMGNVAALSGSCCWLIAATFLRLPVSATHSIVGATVGFALVAHSTKGINWAKLGMIIGSWFVSPVLAGFVSTGLFFICKYFILNKSDPLEPGLRLLPIFYAVTIVINLFSVFYDGPEMFGFDKIPLWGTFVLSFGSGVICAVVIRYLVVPWQRRRIKADCQYSPAAVAVEDPGQVKFKFDSVQSSAQGSEENSQENSRKNSASDITADLEKTVPSLVIESEKCGATNLAAAPATRNGDAKPKVQKGEDAPLVVNEYKTSSTTPVKSPTAEDLNNLNSKNLNSFEAPLSAKALALEKDIKNMSDDVDELKGDLNLGRSSITDRPETARLFSFLQILTAVFGAFAHGGNDVSNAIGPLVSLWLTATNGEVLAKAPTPIWILLYGGVGISVGLWLWGRKVIKTIGEDLTKITPSSGFCIEIGSALTVLIASNIGIPISTTHCKVGSVVFVGRFRARENVDWSIFRNIVLAWALTLPITAGVSAGIMAGFKNFLWEGP